LGVVVLALGAVALAAPSLAAANPACDSTVTHNVTLTSNMSCPGTSGIVVGKSGITINLNHFAVESDNTSNTVGIDNSGGFNQVTVENGTVKNFDDGIVYDATDHGTINNVASFHNSRYGVEFTNSGSGLIEHSKANLNGDDGFNLGGNNKVTVSSTHANNNGGTGILDQFSLDTINGDSMLSNHEWGFFVSQPLTVLTSKGRVYYTIEHSIAENNLWSGFQIDDNTQPSFFQANVFGNTAKSNGSGFPPGEPNFGWGFFATQPVKGNKTNGALNNQNGNCHDVPCHKL
jgi:hypothetical protein